MIDVWNFLFFGIKKVLEAIAIPLLSKKNIYFYTSLRRNKEYRSFQGLLVL